MYFYEYQFKQHQIEQLYPGEEVADRQHWRSLAQIHLIILKSHWKQSFLLMLLTQLSSSTNFPGYVTLINQSDILEDKQLTCLFKQASSQVCHYQVKYINYQINAAVKIENSQARVKDNMNYGFRTMCEAVHKLIERLLDKYSLENKIEYWRNIFRFELKRITQTFNIATPLEPNLKDHSQQPNLQLCNNDLTQS